METRAERRRASKERRLKGLPKSVSELPHWLAPRNRERVVSDEALRTVAKKLGVRE